MKESESNSDLFTKPPSMNYMEIASMLLRWWVSFYFCNFVLFQDFNLFWNCLWDAINRFKLWKVILYLQVGHSSKNLPSPPKKMKFLNSPKPKNQFKFLFSPENLLKFRHYFWVFLQIVSYLNLVDILQIM